MYFCMYSATDCIFICKKVNNNNNNNMHTKWILLPNLEQIAVLVEIEEIKENQN